MRYKRIAFQLFAALGATTQGNLFAADAPAAVKIVREFPISAEPGWPEGVLAILKDVTCSEKLEDDLRFNFEGPHADSWYGLAIRNMEDVNRLIRYFAAIKAESLTLYLRPERGSFLGRGEGAIFSFWNQKILDEWFRAEFRKSSLGIRTFGLHRYKKPLKAEVRLTIFAGNPAVNLTKLEIPLNVNMISAAAATDRADHAIEMKQIDALIEKHQAAQKWSGTAIKKWIADVISKIQSIQPGMTRADLIRLFDEDGGTLRDQSQFALRECAYIKIIVNFQLPGAAAGNEGWSHDRITTVSKPFLETPKPE